MIEVKKNLSFRPPCFVNFDLDLLDFSNRKFHKYFVKPLLMMYQIKDLCLKGREFESPHWILDG